MYFIVVFIFLLFFIYFVDHVIGKKEMHRMKARVLVMESDILLKVLSLSLLVFFSLTLYMLSFFSHDN